MNRALVLGVVVLTLVATGAGTVLGRVAGTERRVTDTYGVEEYPDIWEDTVVWADKSQGDNEEIWTFDLSNGRMEQLSSALGDKTWPRVFGDTVVWMQVDYTVDAISGQTVLTDTLAIHSLSAKSTRLLKEVASSGMPDGHQKFPDIYGDYIVFENEIPRTAPDPSIFDIYLLDLRSGVISPVTNDLLSERLPAVFGNWVVWEEVSIAGGEADVDLWVYRIGCTTAPCSWSVANSPDWDENWASISGDTLVYADYRNDTNRRSDQDETDNGDIYRIDLSPLLDGNPANDSPLPAVPVIVASGSQEEPRLFGDRMVWRDFRANATQADLWAMRLPSGTPEELAVGYGEKWRVQVWDDRVVWEDWRHDLVRTDDIDDFDIYVFCYDQPTCGVPRSETPVLLYVTVVLIVLVALVLAYWLIVRRERPADGEPVEPTRARRPQKGKGPRSAAGKSKGKKGSTWRR